MNNLYSPTQLTAAMIQAAINLGLPNIPANRARWANYLRDEIGVFQRLQLIQEATNILANIVPAGIPDVAFDRGALQNLPGEILGVAEDLMLQPTATESAQIVLENIKEGLASLANFAITSPIVRYGTVVALLATLGNLYQNPPEIFNKVTEVVDNYRASPEEKEKMTKRKELLKDYQAALAAYDERRLQLLEQLKFADSPSAVEQVRVERLRLEDQRKQLQRDRERIDKLGEEIGIPSKDAEASQTPADVADRATKAAEDVKEPEQQLQEDEKIQEEEDTGGQMAFPGDVSIDPLLLYLLERAEKMEKSKSSKSSKKPKQKAGQKKKKKETAWQKHVKKVMKEKGIDSFYGALREAAKTWKK